MGGQVACVQEARVQILVKLDFIFIYHVFYIFVIELFCYGTYLLLLTPTITPGLFCAELSKLLRAIVAERLECLISAGEARV